MIATTYGGAINGSGTGVGKTLVGIRTLHGRGGNRFLIIAPPNTFENWQGTLKAVTGEDLRFCGNQKYAGFPAKEVQANMKAAQDGEDGWFFVGREMFLLQCRHKVYLTKGRGDAKEPIIDPKTGKQKTRTDFKYIWGDKKPFDGVVYDEVQMAAGNESKSRQALKNLQARFKLGQSADWYGTQQENLWNVHDTFWPGVLGMNKNQWIDEYMVTEFDPFSFNKKKVVGEQWPGFFADTMPCYVALPSPVEKPEPERRYVDLLPEQKRLYHELAKNMAAEIDGDVLVVEMPVILNQRLREAALGTFGIVNLDPVIKIDDEGVETIRYPQTVKFEEHHKSAKLDEIKRIQADYPGEPIIVLTGSQKFAEKAARELGGLPYTGKQTDAEKDAAKADFLNGVTNVLVGTSAMAEGLDGLQEVCRIAIILSRVSIPYKNEQFVGRVARRGQKRPVLVFEIVARDSIDVGIVDKSIETILRNNQTKAIAKKEEKNE